MNLCRTHFVMLHVICFIEQPELLAYIEELNNIVCVTLCVCVALYITGNESWSGS